MIRLRAVDIRLFLPFVLVATVAACGVKSIDAFNDTSDGAAQTEQGPQGEQDAQGEQGGVSPPCSGQSCADAGTDGGGQPVFCTHKSFRYAAGAKFKDGCNDCSCGVNGEVKCDDAQCVCSDIACSVMCPNGYKKDANGCPTCECSPSCVPAPCANTCPNGYKKDANGCPTCECKLHSCPLISCGANCPDGYEQDEDGCTTCTCKSHCSSAMTLAACQLKPDLCRWLQSGCADAAPVVDFAGCYPKTSLDCKNSGCSVGKTCMPVSVVPTCALAGAGLVACAACGEEVSLCL